MGGWDGPLSARRSNHRINRDGVGLSKIAARSIGPESGELAGNDVEKFMNFPVLLREQRRDRRGHEN